MTDIFPTDYTLVETEAHLQRVMPELRGAEAIGVDLEADSMFHYQEKVCLVQIATSRLNLLIDPLTVRDLSPLIPIFADGEVQKVFHGADYDIRSLHRDFGIEVRSLFDTQIAARFLGQSEIGLASLLKAYFGVDTDKKYQKKDWSERPMPEPMRAYAALDVCFLLPLARTLERELQDKGRLFCVKEECELLTRVRSQPPRPESLFAGFKGASRLDRRGLAVLERLLRFRDQIARQRDRPPFKVLGNAAILEIVRRKPRSKEDLDGIEGLSARLADQMGDGILQRVREALRLPEEALPIYPRKPWDRPSPATGRRMEVLKTWRDRTAEEWGVDPAVICTNAQIREIALANPEGPDDLKGLNELRQWQKKLFGRGICRVLRQSR